MIDYRKLLRLAVNAASLAAAILMLPQFGAVVPVEWLPGIAAVAAVLNQILSWIRAVNEGVPFIAK